MAVLRLVPVSWLSADCEVVADGARVGFVDCARMREAAELTAEGSAYRASRRRRAFLLERDGMVVASAERTSLWRGSYRVGWEHRTYELVRESAWRREYALRGDSASGMIRPERWSSRAVIADLPNDLPLAVRMFITWVVMTLWRRAAQNATVSGGS